MASVLHGSARTTPRIRAELKAAKTPARLLASYRNSPYRFPCTNVLRKMTKTQIIGAFAACRPKGPAILASEGGEAELCAEGKGRSRAAIHAQLASMIADALRRSFASL